MTDNTPLVQAMARLADVQEGAWLPVPNESAQAFYAFRMWLDSGPNRPVVQNRTSVLFDLEARAKAYDLYCQGNPELPEQTPDQRHKDNLATIRVLKHTTQSQALKLLAALEQSASPAMTLEQLAKVTDLIIKLERLETDQSTHNVSLRGPNLGKLDDSELDQLDQLAQKAEGEQE